MTRFEISASLLGLALLLALAAFGMAQCNAYRWAQYETCMASGTAYAVCTNPRLQSW